MPSFPPTAPTLRKDWKAASQFPLRSQTLLSSADSKSPPVSQTADEGEETEPETSEPATDEHAEDSGYEVNSKGQTYGHVSTGITAENLDVLPDLFAAGINGGHGETLGYINTREFLDTFYDCEQSFDMQTWRNNISDTAVAVDVTYYNSEGEPIGLSPLTQSRKMLSLRQYRTKIVLKMRREIFVRLYRNFAGILTYVKGFLCKITENIKQSVQRRQASLCGVLKTDSPIKRKQLPQPQRAVFLPQ